MFLWLRAACRPTARPSSRAERGRPGDSSAPRPSAPTRVPRTWSSQSAVARQLGLDLSGAHTAYCGTVNRTNEQSLVMPDSVSLGRARADRVPASVSKTMSVGLRGLSFFKHFLYGVDPVAGVITLQANRLVEARMPMFWRAGARMGPSGPL